MAQLNKHPFADSRLVRFLERRILELRPKTQAQIAHEAGFRTPNVLSMIKHGATRLPLDRVVSLAKALDIDAAHLFRLALEQQRDDTTEEAIAQIFREVVSENEAAWLRAIREASGDADPTLTTTRRRQLFAIFGR